MKAQKYRGKLQNELGDNYDIVAQLLDREAIAGLKYEELMYVLFNGQIPMPKIAYFRKKKYGTSQPLMKKEFLVEDGLKLKEEVVGKAWRFEKAADSTAKRGSSVHDNRSQARMPSISGQDSSQQPQTENAEQVKAEEPSKQSPANSPQKHSRSQTTKSKQIQEMKVKKLQLEQMLVVLQAKLNTARNQDEAAEFQKEYNKCFKELTYLRNRHRVMKEQSLLKKIAKETSAAVPAKIVEMLTEMNKIKQSNARILHKQPSYTEKLPKSQQISRLQLIFSHYSKKQTLSTNRYFSDLQKEQNKLKLETFIKFAQDWHLDRIITMEQISATFKARSKGNRWVDQLQFSQILSDIHNLECIKEERPISNDSISHYMQDYIVADHKINRIIMNSEGQAKKEASQYKYKPKSHSGKYLKDIEEEMEIRKKTLDFLAGPKNTLKHEDSRKAKSRNYTMENSRVEADITESRAAYNPSSVNLNDSVNSYAFRFKLKNTKNRIKTQGIIKSIQNTQSFLNKDNPQLQTIESNRENISNRSRDELESKKFRQEREDERRENEMIDNVLNGSSTGALIKKKNPPFQGFEQLIEESSEDEYLNKHLLLPPIQSRKPTRQIHY